jgi:hypothetical protein
MSENLTGGHNTHAIQYWVVKLVILKNMQPVIQPLKNVGNLQLLLNEWRHRENETTIIAIWEENKMPRKMFEFNVGEGNG